MTAISGGSRVVAQALQLAVAHQQAGAGLPYLAVALEARPEQQPYWLSYIDALIQANETQTAQQLLALGRQHGLQGDDVEALAARLEGCTQREATEPTALQSPVGRLSRRRKPTSPAKPQQAPMSGYALWANPTYEC